MSRKPVRGRLAQRLAAAEDGDLKNMAPLHPRSPLAEIAKSANDTDTSSHESTDVDDEDSSYSGSPPPNRKRQSLSKSGRKANAGMYTLLADLNVIFADLRAIARTYQGYAQSDLFARINAFVLNGAEDATECEQKLVQAAFHCSDALDECTKLARRAHLSCVRMIVEHVFDVEVDYADRTGSAAVEFARKNPTSPRGVYYRPKQRRRKEGEPDTAVLPASPQLDDAAAVRRKTFKHLARSLDIETESFTDALVRIEKMRQRLLQTVEQTDFHKDIETAVSFADH